MFVSVCVCVSVCRAVANAMRNGKTLLMNKGYTEDEALTIMSVAGDFGITQVHTPESERRTHMQAHMRAQESAKECRL